MRLQGFIHEQGPLVLQSYAKRSLSIATQLCRLLQNFIGKRITKYKQEVDLLRFKMNGPFSCEDKLHCLDFESSEVKSQEGTRLFTVVSSHDVQFISTVVL